MKSTPILPCLLLLLILSVSSSAQQTNSMDTVRPSMVMQGPLWGAVWHQRGSEYKALCFQAYNIGRWRLDELLKRKHSKPLAIVTDIDETILDNSPYTIHQALLDSGYSQTSWLQWTMQASADTVPGALSFLRYAANKGVAIFYITNRTQAEQSVTLQNLQHYNFPQASPDHLLLRENTSGKESRRQQVAQTHEIGLLFGDNLSDFSAVFDRQPYDERNKIVQANAAEFGDRFIVLPNAMYGDWEGSLYNFDFKHSAKQRDSILIGQLRKY
jgi:5'-nucleotidase (lipoprotein e(P4) family)